MQKLSLSEGGAHQATSWLCFILTTNQAGWDFRFQQVAGKESWIQRTHGGVEEEAKPLTY